MIFVYFIIFSIIIYAVLTVISKLLNWANNSVMKAEGITRQIISLTHIGGIPLLKEGTPSFIALKGDNLVINKTHFLTLSRVKRVQYLVEDQLIEKQKSVINRAVVGGLLLGPVAAVVGGISGIGTKKVIEKQDFLSIDFIDKNGEEITAVFLIGKLGMPDLQDFLKDVNEKVGYQGEQTLTPTVSKPYEV